MTRPGPPTPAVTVITPEAKPPPAPTQYEFGTCSERDPMVNSSPPSTSRLIAIASTGAGSHSTSSAPGTVPTSPAGTTFAARPQSRSARTTVRFSSAATIPHTLVTRIPSTGPSAITRNGEDSSAKPIPVVRTETAPARTASAARARGHHCGSVTRATVRGRRDGEADCTDCCRGGASGGARCAGMAGAGRRLRGGWSGGGAAAMASGDTRWRMRQVLSPSTRRRHAGTARHGRRGAAAEGAGAPKRCHDRRGCRVIPLTPLWHPFSRGHQRSYSCHEHMRRVRTPRPIRPRSGLCDVLPTQKRRRDPRMDSRHDVTVGHELQAAAETGQIPVVPATADAGDHAPTWRSTLAVTISLVVTFAAVALVSL